MKLIKIGVTGDLRKRLYALRGSSPVALELLAHMPGARRDEVQLQQRLHFHRKHGEWFADSSAVRACIAEALEHPQAIPARPMELTPKVWRAAEEVMRLTFLGEDAALELLRGSCDIIRAVDRGKMRDAGKLIADAYAKLNCQ